MPISRSSTPLERQRQRCAQPSSQPINLTLLSEETWNYRSGTGARDEGEGGEGGEVRAPKQVHGGIQVRHKFQNVDLHRRRDYHFFWCHFGVVKELSFTIEEIQQFRIPATSQLRPAFNDMLDALEILTTSGVVLWSRSNPSLGPNVVNSLIHDVFIEEKGRTTRSQTDGTSSQRNPSYRYENFTLKWTLVKELGLIFVAVYQSLLHLSWVDKLLDNISAIFADVYRDQLSKPDATIARYDFDGYYDQQLRELEPSTGAPTFAEPPSVLTGKKEELQEGDTGGPPPPPPVPGLFAAQLRTAPREGDIAENSPLHSRESSRPTTPLPGHLMTAKNGPGGRGSRRSRKARNPASHPSSGDETRNGKQPKSQVKKMRKWDADGLADEDGERTLDYSTKNLDTIDHESRPPPPMETITQAGWGSKNSKGQFVLKDLDDEVSTILQRADMQKEKHGPSHSLVGSSFGAISGYFRNIVGGKTLTKQDLEKPLKGMEDHLIQKNVAREAALRLCEGVEREMVGKKTGSFESIEKALRPALEASLRRILTPTSSLDLLQEIQSVTAPTVKTSSPRPYVISFVGVNGVGKSTNLAKICYFLLQNNYRILVAACDTFRSGAVEQLNHHVRNLKELSARENVGDVDLYQRGYGKDAANVAKDAVAYAASHDFNVVLIDTAGRRHNDARLMSSLEKFANFAKPDKILMVGEALVGTDSVMQARNFNAAFGAGRNLDGFIISKCDTVGDMVGALVSMVHATGIPVVFLGVGQHYGDLRNLSVSWAVNLLMS